MTMVKEIYARQNPYDLGGCISNLSQVFGAFGPDWFIPVEPLRPISDGVSFPKLGELGVTREAKPPTALDAPLANSTQTVEYSALEGSSEMEAIWRARYNVDQPSLGDEKVDASCAAPGCMPARS